MSPKETYYDILGVAPTATEEQIKQAYRKLARQFHPDVNNSPDAEARFKEINIAYATLSDSLKRADYDQVVGDTGVRGGPAPVTGGAASAAARAARGGATAYPTPNRQALFRAAYARVTVAALVGAVVGILVQLGYGYATEVGVATRPLALGSLAGLLLGGFWGADLNFKVETFFGSGWVGRSYTFARTVVISLGLAYLFGLIGAALDQVLTGRSRVLTLTFVLLGLLVGAVVGSDGDTPEKLRSASGRFNLFYTLLRGAEIGAVGALIAGTLGGLLAQLGVADIFGWSIFVGFALGMIVGSVKPPNLAAYASYASASIKNIIIILMVLAALLAGLGAGIVLGPQFGSVFGT